MARKTRVSERARVSSFVSEKYLKPGLDVNMRDSITSYAIKPEVNILRLENVNSGAWRDWL